MQVERHQRQRVDAARDALHEVVMEVIRESGLSVNSFDDLTEVGESIALEGEIPESDR